MVLKQRDNCTANLLTLSPVLHQQGDLFLQPSQQKQRLFSGFPPHVYVVNLQYQIALVESLLLGWRPWRHLLDEDAGFVATGDADSDISVRVLFEGNETWL